MAFRTWRERVVQAVLFEFGGIALVTPLLTTIFGMEPGRSVSLLLLLSLIVLVWTPLHNTVFDWIEWQCVGRCASDRPARWRLVHAISLELTAMAFTCPTVMTLAGKGVVKALEVNLSLTLAYVVYAIFFYAAYDWMRPLAKAQT